MLGESASITPSDQNNFDWSVSKLIKLAWQTKWLVLGCIAISVALGFLYLQNCETIYAVRARLLVHHQGSPLDRSAKTDRDKEFIATQAEIINSPAVISPVMNGSFLADQELLITDIFENLDVDQVSDTNVISVSYRCQNPDEGIKIVDGILGSYQQFLQELNDGSRSESLRLLTRSEEKLRTKLDEREAQYLELREKGPLAEQNNHTIFKESTLVGLSRALIEAREQRINLQIRKELLAASSRDDDTSTRHVRHKPAVSAVDRDAPIVREVEFRSAIPPNDEDEAMDASHVVDVELASMPEFSLVLRELLAAELREKELSRHSGSNHPGLRAARQQVADLSERLRELRVRVPLDVDRELTMAQTRERELFKFYQQELEKAKVNDRFVVKEGMELDGIERLKTIHGSIVAQLNDWHLVEPSGNDSIGVNVVVLESPTIGTGPVWPKESLFLSLCVATGLLVGMGIVFVTKTSV